jgi:hypothetical protein
MLSITVSSISVAGSVMPTVGISPSAHSVGEGAAMPTVGISPARTLKVKVRVKSNVTKQSLNFFMVSPEEQLVWNNSGGGSTNSESQNAGIITLTETFPIN